MRVIIHYPKPIKQLSSQKLPLLVDGKIAGTVTQGKILSLPITQPSVSLSVQGDKKSAIQVKEGDRVQIVENSKYFTLYYLSRNRPITRYIEKGSKVLSTLEPFSIYILS